MPAKNSVKQYIENGYYHIYNRGVEKRKIFLDHQDYTFFLNLLQKYLDPTLPLKGLKGSDPHPLSKEVDLLAFCLMPNHFHLMIKQKTINGVTKLMRAVCTTYSMYFNTKYKRVGTLYQGKFKGTLIQEDIYFIHLSRYINLNPGSDPSSYRYSSYKYYLGTLSSTWVKPKEILDFFKTAQKIHLKDYLSYQSFIEDYKEDSEDILGDLVLEDTGSDPL